MEYSFFTTLQAGWLNAWIPSFGMVLIQFIYMAIFREGGKRAVDTSWYTAKDKANASVSTILQIAILVLSVFVPFKFDTAWFLAGMVVYVLSLGLFVRAFHSYVATPAGKTIKGGVYRWSRNPMYFFFFYGDVRRLYRFRLVVDATHHDPLHHCHAFPHIGRRTLL